MRPSRAITALVPASSRSLSGWSGQGPSRSVRHWDATSCGANTCPSHVLQFEVYDEHGNLVGRTDYAWPEFGMFGEFDGLVKYERYLRPGETAAQAVVREKRREDLLREITGWIMIRLIWADLFRQGATGARIRKQLVRGHSLAG